MKIIETTFEQLPKKRLEIGFEGENQRATVRIDCSSVFAEYPNATPALIVKPLFADAYPVVVDRNGVCVDWLITSQILSFNGDGEIQLVFYKDQVICKSAVSKIRVSRSLMVSGEMPDPVAQWIDDANAKLAEVDAVIVSIDEMDATAHGLPEGSAPTAEVQDVDDHKRIVLGIPAGATGAKGDKGDKGDRGEVGATPQVGIGTVQTLPAGSSATASMSGTTENPLLNLGIPKGDRGEKGDKGDTGEKGDTGATGATGATPDFSIGTVSTLPAGSSATAEITGTAENPVLSLGIPQGVQGIQGVQGEKGDPGEGVPAGGITGQVLAKASDTDRDTEWIHVAPVIKNTASGAIASFPDGADGHPIDELKVQIEPAQDLHGYDHPWPAGGNVNQITVNRTEGLLDDYYPDTKRAFEYDKYYVGLSFNNYYLKSLITEYSVGNNTVSLKTVRNAYGIAFPVAVTSNTEYFVGATYNGTSRIAVSFFDADGSLINYRQLPVGESQAITTPAECVTCVLVVYDSSASGQSVGIADVFFNSPSSETTYSPYSNICPITGWTAAKVTRTGANVWDEEWEVGALDANGGPIVVSAIRSKNYVPVIGGATYFEYASNDTAMWMNISQYDSNKAFIKQGALYSKNAITLETNTAFLKFYMVSAYGTTYNHDISINYPATDTEYHAYQGNTYDITLPTEAGTVYGGYLAIAEDGSGVLTVDRAMADMGSLVWNYNTTYAFFTSNSIPTRKTGVLNVWSDLFKTMGGSWSGTPVQNALWGNGSNTTLYVQTPPLDNVNDFMALIDGHQLMYELATPITYTLTAAQVTTFLGTNNVWADTGDVTVKYNADTKLYIDGKIAELVAQIVNS